MQTAEDASQEAEEELREGDLMSKMPGLLDALQLMDCLTIQKQHIEKLLTYKGIQYSGFNKPTGEELEKSEVGSVGNRSFLNRKASVALSTRQSLLLHSASQRSGLKSESVSIADDDHETMSIATVLLSLQVLGKTAHLI